MQKKPRNGWLVLIALYYYSIIASFNLLKVPPLFSLLMKDFGLNSSNVGYIVSASSVAALILVFPSALIAKRIGTYRCGLIAITCSVIGCVIGALAPSLPILLVGRFIEGCGLGMTGVIGSTTIPQYFKGKKLGLPMAIWSTWFAVGSALGSLVSGRVGHGFENWRASWWLGAILAAIGFVIFATVVRENKADDHTHAVPQPAQLPSPGKKQSDFLLGIKNLRIWCIALFFATLLSCCVGFLSFGTEFFSEVYGMERTDASALASLGYWFTVVGGVVAGIVSRVRKGNSLRGQFVQLILCGVMSMAVYPFGFLVTPEWIIPYLFACGFVNGFTCGVTFGTVPRLVNHPRVTGISMGILFTCQNISSFCASPMTGACVEGGNWTGAVFPMLCITGVGLLFTILATIFSLRKERRQNALQTENAKVEEVVALQAKIEELQQSEQQIQSDIDSAKAALDAALAENNTLQQKLEQVLSERDALQADCAKAQDALAALKKEHEQTLAELSSAKDEAARYILEARRASVQEQEALAEAKKLRSQLEDLKTMPLWKRAIWRG